MRKARGANPGFREIGETQSLILLARCGENRKLRIMMHVWQIRLIVQGVGHGGCYARLAGPIDCAGGPWRMLCMTAIPLFRFTGLQGASRHLRSKPYATPAPNPADPIF
jgi:hypothetical protein